MDENLKQSYKESVERVALKERITISLEDKREELDKLYKDLEVLKTKVKKEGKDVEKLEKISVANLIATLSGRKEEKLEKEELEFFNAKSELESFMLNVTSCEDQVKHYEKKIVELEDAEENYRRTREKLKEALIKSNDNEISNRLKGLDEEIHNIEKEVKEMEEVLVAGAKVLQNISKARETLSSAENWGLYDTVGGGLFSSIIKQNKIAEAKKYIQDIEMSFKELDKELKDIKIDFNNVLNITDFDITFDIWLDNVFTDFSVLNKIKDANKKIIALETEVKKLLKNIKDGKENNIVKMDDIEKEIDNKLKLS